MPSCLGLYVENNLIKYAKVSKEREVVKIESFGMKFYDKLGDAIKQIIAETYSFKNPISINLSEEAYNYFYMFSLLNKNDLKKAIGTEFESFCAEKGINKNALETRYALVNDVMDKEKIKVVHVSVNKNTISTIEQQFNENKVSTISPIGISIANIANLKPKENVAIVNMEEKTTMTTIVDQKVYSVDSIDEGAKDILNNINLKENSYSKAYEICKNSTIYTMEGKELQDEENEYLDDIMPTLYKIVTKVKEIVEQNTIKLEKIYITGTLSVINNIDLYFQEFFKNEKCEILKPFFIHDSVKINIKDYVEVNSGIALAMQGLGYGIKEMNFQKPTLGNSLPDWMKLEIGKSSGKEGRKNLEISKYVHFDLKEKLDHTEKWMLRIAGGVLIFTMIYSGFSIFLNSQISKKMTEANTTKADINSQITLANNDINKIKDKTNNYTQLSDNLKNISAQIKENNKNRNIIPTLLSQIMYVIPKDVQITSIENTTANHIVINAQSKKYESLGYFKAKIKQDEILDSNTVVSSSGVKQGDWISVMIEGDLP